MNRTECSRGELQSYFSQNYHKGYLHFLKMEIGMRKQFCRKKRKRAENALLVVWLHGACHPVSGRQKEPLFDTVTLGQHAGWNTLGILISPLRTTSSAWQLPLAPEFAMRKPTLQLQVGGKRKKKNLSGKQVRRQLMWDTCRIHAAHLNLTLSASLYVGGEAQ